MNISPGIRQIETQIENLSREDAEGGKKRLPLPAA
jgi:hypothetical protein